MLAKYKGTCYTCGQPINVGEEISWSRRNAGRAYHARCKESVAIAVGGDGVAHVVKPATDSDILEQLKAMLAKAEGKTGEVRIPDTGDAAQLEAKYRKPKPLPIKALGTNSTWYDILSAILPISNRILLVGPPSSGKSTTAMKTGGVKHRLTMTETTSREDGIGMFHLIDGETRWVDGPMTTAMRNGEAVLIDEIDRYSPEFASLLYSLIDDKPHISLPTGELVEAKDGYKVIMTTNETVETLPVAVQDRIEVIIMASTPHEAALADVPQASKDVCMRYYKAIPVPALRLLPTVRRIRMFHKLISASVPNQIAGELVFGKAGATEILSALTSAEGNK